MRMLTNQDFADELLRVLDEVRVIAQAEITAQGHVASGRGRDSVEGVIISQEAKKIVGAIMAADYMVGPVDKGVAANRVPFSPNSGAATSQYIQGIMDWIQNYIKPSFSDEEALSFAIAIGKTAIKEGHPTNGSYSFSENGRRTAWVENGIEKNEGLIRNKLRLFEIIKASLENEIRKASA